MTADKRGLSIQFSEAVLHNKCSSALLSDCRRGVSPRVFPGINEKRAVRHRLQSDKAQRGEKELVRGIAHFVALILISHALVANAQERDAGALRGVVEDPSRYPIAGAQVRLENRNTRQESATTSDETGEFVFQTLAQGEYVLLVKAEGFEEQTLTISVGQPASPLRIRLKIADTSEEVTVTAKDLSSPSAEENIDSIEMDQHSLRNLPAKDGDPLAAASMFLAPAAFGVGGPKLIVDGVEGAALELP